jgi:GNAT superfamily N-acetyltransferase
MNIEVREENPLGSTAASLIAELSAELAAIYGDDGSGAFKPEDVMGERAAFVVAWREGEAVACGALRPTEDSKTAEVKRMFVRRAARGSGFSRKILGKLEELAAAYGYEQIILETGTLQTEALKLYESSGYTRSECYGKYIGNPISVCFEKKLNVPEK